MVVTACTGPVQWPAQKEEEEKEKEVLAAARGQVRGR